MLTLWSENGRKPAWGTGVALAGSKRGWVDFGSTGADALRSTQGRRPGEQNDYKKVTSGEHGGDAGARGAVGTRPICIRRVSKSLGSRCAVLSRCGVSVSFLLCLPPATRKAYPLPRRVHCNAPIGSDTGLRLKIAKRGQF